MQSDGMPRAGDVWRRQFDNELLDVSVVFRGLVTFYMRKWPKHPRQHDVSEFVKYHDRVNPSALQEELRRGGSPRSELEGEDAPIEAEEKITKLFEKRVSGIGMAIAEGFTLTAIGGFTNGCKGGGNGVRRR